MHQALVTAYSYALPPIFLYLVPVLGAAFVLSFFLPERKLRTTLGPEDALAAAPAADGAEAGAETGTPGTERTYPGTPLPGATVTLIDPSGRQVARGHTGADGPYQISAPAQGYTLIAMASAHHIGMTVADGAETTQDAEPRSGARVAGTARTATGAAIPDARVMLLDADGNVAAVAAGRLRVSSGELHTHDVQPGHPGGITLRNL